MTCEPHVRAELEEELAAERADALDPADVRPSRLVGPYPPPPPVIDPDTATITAQAR